jgi:hypothetical protein
MKCVHKTQVYSVKYDNTYTLTTTLQTVVYLLKRYRYSDYQEIPSVDPDDSSQRSQIPAIEPFTWSSSFQFTYTLFLSLSLSASLRLVPI